MYKPIISITFGETIYVDMKLTETNHDKLFEHTKKEALKRGFKKGVRFMCAHNNRLGVCDGTFNEKYTIGINGIYTGGEWVFIENKNSPL